MTGTGPQPPPLPLPSTRRPLTGWGRTAPTVADLTPVRSGEDVDRVLSAAADDGRGVVARGLARSYGDAAQCGGGVVVDVTGLDTVFEADLDTGLVRVGAGASLDALMRAFVPRGWFVPVTPGTRYVTVGGAIAADIHGKNHHRDGSFCSHVERMSLATPTGRVELSAHSDPDLFWATAGGMGLTGIVVDATLRMRPVETATMVVDTERAQNLDDCMARMADGDGRYGYSVAWVDCLARGPRMGRAVLGRADHARMEDLPRSRRRPGPALRPARPGRGARHGALGAVQRRHRGSVQRAVVPQGPPGPQRPAPEHRHLLPPARRRGRLEPHVRAPGAGATPVRRPDRSGGRPARPRDASRSTVAWPRS